MPTRAQERDAAAVELARLLDRSAPAEAELTFARLAYVLERVGATSSGRALPIPAAGTDDYAWWVEREPGASIFDQVFWRSA